MAKTATKPAKSDDFNWQDHLDEFKDYIVEDLWPLVRPVEEFTLNPVNSLIHTDADLQQTAASLKEFKQRQALVYNKNNKQITAGNGRYLAATNILKWKYLAFVGEEDDLLTATRWGIADNLTGRAAQFDLTNVGDMMKSMDEQDGLSIPGMTEAIFESWTDDDPIGEDGDGSDKDWEEFNEDIETTHQCPKCGFEFSPNQ